jgi:hypothetical protein
VGAEALLRVAEEGHEPRVPLQLVRVQVPVEGPDVGRREAEVQAGAGLHERRHGPAELELRGHGLAEGAQQLDLVLRPAPRLRPEDAQGAHDLAPDPDRHPEVAAREPAGERRAVAHPRVGARVLDRQGRPAEHGDGAEGVLQGPLALPGVEGQPVDAHLDLAVRVDRDLAVGRVEGLGGQAGEPVDHVAAPPGQEPAGRAPAAGAG